MHASGKVKKALTRRYSCRNSDWLLKCVEFCAAADAAVAYIRNTAGPGNVSLLKRTKNRLIFRLKDVAAHSDISSVLVKSYSMQGLKHKLYRYRRYGAVEAANLLTAAERKVPVPLVYGYGQTGRFCFIDATIVMMEDLNGYRHISDMLLAEDLNDSDKFELLKRAGRLFARLYEGGCNHIDLSGQAVLLSEKGNDDRLIDFHYSAFHERPSVRILMLQSAYFGNSMAAAVSEELLETWIRQMLQELSIKKSDDWLKVYRQFKSRRLSRKQRLTVS